MLLRFHISAELDDYQSMQWPLANLLKYLHNRTESHGTDLFKQTKNSADSQACLPSFYPTPPK